MRSKSLIIPVMIAVSISLAAVACAMPAARPPAPGKILKLGAIHALSGPGAEWGKEAEPLGPIFEEILRQEGGIKVGDDIYQVKMVQVDGPIFPPSADVAAARKLVYDEKVDAICIYYGIANASIAAVTTPAKVVFNQSTLMSSYYDPVKFPYCFFGYPNLQVSGVQPLAVALAIKAKTIAFAGTKTGNQYLDAVSATADRVYGQQYGIKVVRAEWGSGEVDFTPYLQRMKEQGVDMIYTMENLNTVGLLRKQGIQMGFRVPIVLDSSILELDYMKQVVGGDADALEGICGDYSGAIWELKKTKISPYYLDFVEKIKKAWKAKVGKALDYNMSIISVGCQMYCQYIEAVKKAGTKDPDAVMKAINGGTFDTFLGTYTTCAKNGADVVFGYPCAISIIKNGKVQYLTEYPLRDINKDNPINVTAEMVQVPGGTPAATVTSAPAIETSFAASTYVSEPYGISLAYPKRWAIGMPVPPTIFSVSEGGQVPVLNISVYSKGSMQKEVEAQRAANNMTNIKYVVQDQDFTLRDGKTVAKYSVSTADYSGATFKLRTYSITIEKGDKLISFAITTLDGMEDEALFKEIFNTVIVK